MDSGKSIDKQVISRVKARDLEGGVNILLKHLEQDPVSESIYSVRDFLDPHLYCHKLDLEKLFQSCYRAVHARPKMGGAWALLGKLYKAQERYSQALQCYLKAFAYQPSLLNLMDLAFGYRNLGRFDHSSKLIFCKELFLRYFTGEDGVNSTFRLVKQWQLSWALTTVNLKRNNREIVREIEKNSPPVVLLNFYFSQHDLHGGTGRKLIDLFNRLQGRGIAFRVVHPLPVCIFGVDYKKVASKYHLPTTCRQCVYSCVIKRNSYVELCSRRDNELPHNLPEELEKRRVNRKTPTVCLNCRHFAAGLCTGLCKK